MGWFKTVKLEDSCFKGLNTVLHRRTGTVLVAIVVDIANETKAAAHNSATDGRGRGARQSFNRAVYEL